MDELPNPTHDEKAGSPEPLLQAIARALARQAVREAISNWETRSAGAPVAGSARPFNGDSNAKY